MKCALGCKSLDNLLMCFKLVKSNHEKSNFSDKIGNNFRLINQELLKRTFHSSVCRPARRCAGG